MSPATSTATTDLHVEHLNVADLSYDAANLRLHEPKSIDALVASLRRFGQQKPIVIDKNNVVIAGNGTLEAARKLGWQTISVVRSCLSDLDRVLYAIADNRTAELSKWDNDAVRKTLASMPVEQLSSTGFTLEDLDALTPEVVGQTTLSHVSEPPVPKVATSIAGDVWLLGAHRLMCGSCTVADDVKRVMHGERAALFATDPPYLVDYDGTNHPQDFGNKDWSDTYGQTWDDADANSQLYDQFVSVACAHAIKKNAAWYCWHASKRQALLESVWNKHGAFVHVQIIWAKHKPILTRSMYMWQHEPCLMGWLKGNMPALQKVGRERTVWSIETIPNGEDRPDHPTPKPLEVFATPMQQHLTKGELCYEPFSGSGTQIIVAEQLEMRCFALEISPVYVDVAVLRWQKLTGKQAVLENDGRTFDQLAIDRKNAPCPSAPVEPAVTPVVESSVPDDTATRTPPSTNARRGKASRPAQAAAGTGGRGKSSAATS